MLGEAPLLRFVALYALLYSAFGVASPYLAALVGERGLSSEQIGVVFALATLMRLAAAPLAGGIADRFAALRLVLGGCLLAAAGAALLYVSAGASIALVAAVLLHAMALAPAAPISDALALTAAKRQRFEYGWVRGSGSGAFIAGTLLAGPLVGQHGLGLVLWLQAGLLVAAAGAVRLIPSQPRLVESRLRLAHVRGLIADPILRRLVLVAALVLGSHALHDTFSVIRWTEAGVPPATIGLLWSMSVASEVVVFLLIGPRLIARTGSANALLIAAAAGVLRWTVAAFTTDVMALGFIQPLHGITFALLHLAAMRVLSLRVPQELAATAQALYGTVGIGLASAALTILSGWLYGRFGGASFYLMALFCAAAIPVAAGLANALRAVDRPV
jgi:PPP family 3-phenylpropionic acid transporter